MNAKIGRNDPCPCGSGLKFKKCCIDKPELLEQPTAPVNKNELKTDDLRAPLPTLSELFGGVKVGGESDSNILKAFNNDDDKLYRNDYDDYDEDYDDNDNESESDDDDDCASLDYLRLAESFRAKTSEELFAKLNALGLPITREILAADAARYDSAYIMGSDWGQRYHIIETAREEAVVWEAARVLWEKLDPAGTPCLETALDEISEGYALWECDCDNDGALERWFAAWEMLKASLSRISRTFDEIDDHITTPEGGLREWGKDVCSLLIDLAEERGGDEYETRRKKFITEFVAAFRDFPVAIAVNLKCEPAERLFKKGKAAEADAIFESLEAEYPHCYMVYERRAAAYAGKMFIEDNSLPPDLEKAQHIIERGIAVENIDKRFVLLIILREINRQLFNAGRLEGSNLEAALAVDEFVKKYKRAPLKEKLNMLDELCIGNALRSFERFVEPVHYYETLALELADEGMIGRALGLAALLELRQPELFKYHFAAFEYLNAMEKLAGGDAKSARRSIERLLNYYSSNYEYILLIAKAAAAGGMETAVEDQCLTAAHRFYLYEGGSHKNSLSDDFKFLAASIIFGKAYAKYEAGEGIDEKELGNKLFMTGWPGSPSATAKHFVEEITGTCRPSTLSKNSLWNTKISEFIDALFRMSLQYSRRMKVEKGHGFMFSNNVWSFVINFLMRRATIGHRQPDPDKFFKFNKYDLKDFAFDRCRPFGDEKDNLPETAASLKLMNTVYEFLRDAGTVDDETCRSAGDAAGWALSKVLARYQKRAWQLEFVERL